MNNNINDPNNNDGINEIKQKGIFWVENILNGNLTKTKPGSISYLLFGESQSMQSIYIKLGRFGEFLSKELVKNNNNLELLQCGVQTINNTKKDIDLIFKDEKNKKIYYRELKANIELDTEKIPATINKCKEIEFSLQSQYLEYDIDYGILNWSVYDRQILSAGLSNIKTFETNGIKIDHMENFLKIINVLWNKNDYYTYFRKIGNIIKIKCH